MVGVFLNFVVSQVGRSILYAPQLKKTQIRQITNRVKATNRRQQTWMFYLIPRKKTDWKQPPLVKGVLCPNITSLAVSSSYCCRMCTNIFTAITTQQWWNVKYICSSTVLKYNFGVLVLFSAASYFHSSTIWMQILHYT